MTIRGPLDRVKRCREDVCCMIDGWRWWDDQKQECQLPDEQECIDEFLQDEDPAPQIEEDRVETLQEEDLTPHSEDTVKILQQEGPGRQSEDRE